MLSTLLVAEHGQAFASAASSAAGAEAAHRRAGAPAMLYEELQPAGEPALLRAPLRRRRRRAAHRGAAAARWASGADATSPRGLLARLPPAAGHRAGTRAPARRAARDEPETGLDPDGVPCSTSSRSARGAHRARLHAPRRPHRRLGHRPRAAGARARGGGHRERGGAATRARCRRERGAGRDRRTCASPGATAPAGSPPPPSRRSPCSPTRSPSTSRRRRAPAAAGRALDHVPLRRRLRGRPASFQGRSRTAPSMRCCCRPSRPP
jgi:hypothetical protein